ELAVLAGEHLVVRVLYADVAEHEGLVADDLGEETAGRVAPLELEPAAVVHTRRLRHDDAVGRDDGPPRVVDHAQRGAHVERVVLEVAGVDDLQVRKLSDEDQHEDDDRDRDAPDAAVHDLDTLVATVVTRRRAADVRARALSSEMRSSSARITKLATRDEPPYEMNGSVMPVSGITSVTPPMITNVWMPMIAVRPAANSFGNGRSACNAIRKPDPMNNRMAVMIATVPSNPSSSPIAEK